MGVPYTNVTGDLRQANYSSLREGKLEFRRRTEQFQHGTLIFQMCRPVWRRWLLDAVLAGGLELPGFASDPARFLAVKSIPPKWDWVDPLKDRKAEIEAIEAGLKSRSDVIESEGYDAEEVDRRIAADHAREAELGLSFGPQAQGHEVRDRRDRAAVLHQLAEQGGEQEQREELRQEARGAAHEGLGPVCERRLARGGRRE
jgi:lambda family phage portal protein